MQQLLLGSIQSSLFEKIVQALQNIVLKNVGTKKTKMGCLLHKYDSDRIDHLGGRRGLASLLRELPRVDGHL